MNDGFSGEIHGVLFFACIAWVVFSLVASDGYFSLSVVRICRDTVSYNTRYFVLLNKKEKRKKRPFGQPIFLVSIHSLLCYCSSV